MKFRSAKFHLVFLMFVSFVFAAEDGFVSNFTYSAGPGPSTGSLWVVSRGTSGSGVSLVSLALGAGNINVSKMSTELLPDSITPVQDGVFSDVTAEHRRTPFAKAGKLGFVVPLVAESDSGYLVPWGYFSGRAANTVTTKPLPTPPGEFPEHPEMAHAVSGFAFDSISNALWMARGVYGLLKEDINAGINSSKRSQFVVNVKTLTLDSLGNSSKIDTATNPAVYGIARNAGGQFWLATSGGLFSLDMATRKLSRTGVAGLDTARVTGVWAGGTPFQVVAETSKRYKTSTEDRLWRSYGGKPFSEVVFRDTVGKVQKNIYDKSDFTTSDVAFIGNRAFLSVQAVEGSKSGILKLDSVGAIPFDDEEQWLYGLNAGVVDRNVEVTAVAAFPLSAKVTGLVVCTNGAGISVSADTGKTWTHIMNQASLKNDLGSIRMIPSVIGAGNQSMVSYKVSKNSKITIEVFSYDMRKVRTVVKNAERMASSSRSTLPSEDFWDGRDDGGNAVTMGVYYVRVKDNHGHVGWGKAMTLGGR